MKLTIITINYNNAEGLRKTIQSVLGQSFKDYEYIIIDGASTDGSINIIKQYSDKINYWMSEKDKGVYNAMNKGIRQAKGDFLLMLNSGDFLINSEVLNEVFSNDIESCDILYGNIEWRNKDLFHSLYQPPDDLTLQFFFTKSLAHQASFIKRSAHQIVGAYDEGMKICADWNFFILAAGKYNLKFRHLSLIVSVGNTNGMSWDGVNYYTIQRERLSVIKKHFPSYLHTFKKFKKVNDPGFVNRLRIIKKTFLKKYLLK